MVRVGDRVVVKGWPEIVVKVARIYQVDPRGNETKWDFDTARIMLDLDWGEYGTSKVALHDKNRTWFPYTSSN